MMALRQRAPRTVALADDGIDGAFDKTGGNPFAVAVTFGIVRNY